MISPLFAQILRSGRDRFNAQFAAARHAQPALDGDGFGRFLGESVDPLVQAVDRVRPDRAIDTATAAYDVALELATLQLIGPGARHRLLEQGWGRLFFGTPALVAAEPTRVLAAGCNAIHSLASTPGARPEEWIAHMEQLGPACADVEMWLRLGQVAAWRAGLAHFRNGALAAADSLPESIALGIFGTPSHAWSDLRVRLKAFPWFDPAKPDLDRGSSRVVMRAGRFRGFGGAFSRPPRVFAADSHFLVSSGDEWWALTADAFGATFHRHSAAEADGSSPVCTGGANVDGTRVTVRGHAIEAAEFGEVTSAAANDTTLAFTAQFTYAVVLVALPA